MLPPCAAMCGTGGLKLRHTLSLRGPVACPQAVLVGTLDGASAASRSVDVMRAGAWALGGPLDVVHAALCKGGAEFWVFGGAMNTEKAALELGEPVMVARSTLEVIFKTTSAVQAKERGANGANGLRQLSLDGGCLARLGMVSGL